MAAAAGSDNGRAGGGDALKKRRGKAPKAYSIWDGEASVWRNAAGEPRPEGQRRRNNAAQRRPSASMRRRRAPTLRKGRNAPQLLAFDEAAFAAAPAVHVGNLSTECTYCSALLFPGEVMAAKHGNGKRGRSCCSQGAVHVPKIKRVETIDAMWNDVGSSRCAPRSLAPALTLLTGLHPIVAGCSSTIRAGSTTRWRSRPRRLSRRVACPVGAGGRPSRSRASCTTAWARSPRRTGTRRSARSCTCTTPRSRARRRRGGMRA